jgi:hypothetical protein
MQTRTVTTADLARSVIAVPPMARDKDLKFDRAENEKILRHIEAGQVTTMLYGGNANVYHLALDEYELLLEQLTAATAPTTLVVPSAGPTFGLMMEQAKTIRRYRFQTVMVLPQQGITTSAGVATAGWRVEERRSLSELPQLPPRIVRPSDDTLFTPSKALSCHSITFPLCPLVPYGLRPPD